MTHCFHAIIGFYQFNILYKAYGKFNYVVNFLIKLDTVFLPWSRTLYSKEDFIFLSFDLLSWHQVKHFDISFCNKASSTSLAIKKMLIFVISSMLWCWASLKRLSNKIRKSKRLGWIFVDLTRLTLRQFCKIPHVRSALLTCDQFSSFAIDSVLLQRWGKSLAKKQIKSVIFLQLMFWKRIGV